MTLLIRLKFSVNQSGGFLVASYGLVLNLTLGLGFSFFQVQVTGPSDVAHFSNFLKIYSLFELFKAKAIFFAFLRPRLIRWAFYAQDLCVSFLWLRLAN